MFFSFEAVVPNCLWTPGWEPWKPVNVACSQAPLRELQRYITVYPSLGKPIRPLRLPLQTNIYFQRISPTARSTQGIQSTGAKEATKSHLLLRSMPECISSLSLAEIVSGLSERMVQVFGDIPELMGVMMLRYCPQLTLRPHSTSSQNHFPTGRWGATAILPATMATSQQRGKGFCCGIMGPRREVALPWTRIQFV